MNDATAGGPAGVPVGPPRRQILKRHQGRWTVAFLVLAFALAGFWIARVGTGLEAAEIVYFVRVATFNTSLNRPTSGQLATDLVGGRDPQGRQVAEILQRVEADIVLLNEFDFDSSGAALTAFAEEYLAVPQNGAPARHYPHRYSAPVNTGVPSGFDLDGNGTVGGPGDCWGYGTHPGQYGMAVLSRYPIQEERVRTFQRFRWQAMPGHRMPEGFYSEQAAAQVPLSSKSHWDVPIQVGPDGMVLHLLASHPTPPVFDGPDDRNGRRNADEIRFWADYIDPEAADYIVDDRGTAGGLAPGAGFVIAGDLNADPWDGDSLDGAAQQLLDHPRVSKAPAPRSAGGAVMARQQWGANSGQRGDPAEDTADFGDGRGQPGNLRVDYVLPAATLNVLDSGVFWPGPDGPHAALLECSDHRPVWVDVEVARPGSDGPR